MSKRRHSGVIAAGLGALAATADLRVLLGIVAALTVVFGVTCISLAAQYSKEAGPRAKPFAGLAELLRDGNYGRFVLSNLLYNFGQGNFCGFPTLFVREAARGSQEMAALSPGIAQATSTEARFGGGAVSDTLFRGRRKGLVIGIGIASVVLLEAMPLAAGWPGVVMMIVIPGLGITAACYAGLIQNMSIKAVEPRLTGPAVGYNGICTRMGATVGPPAFGAIVDATGSYTGGWLMTASVVAVGVLLLGFGFRPGGCG